MILRRISEIAESAEQVVLQQVSRVLEVPLEDEEMMLTIRLFDDRFRLFGKCKRCGEEIEISELPYDCQESWASIIAKRASHFAGNWNRHLATHAIRAAPTKR